MEREFTYYRLHIPTGIVSRHTIQLHNAIALMVLLNKWNAMASPDQKRFKYWCDSSQLGNLITAPFSQ